MTAEAKGSPRRSGPGCLRGIAVFLVLFACAFVAAQTDGTRFERIDFVFYCVFLFATALWSTTVIALRFVDDLDSLLSPSRRAARVALRRQMQDFGYREVETSAGERARFEGTSPSGRAVVARLARLVVGERAEVSVAIENGTPFTVTRERWLARGPREPTGNALFDERFRVEAGPARALGAKEELVILVERLFDQHGIERLEVEPGRIVGIRPVSGTDAGAFRELAFALERLVPFFERRMLEVSVLRGARRAFHASGSPRCPYCFDAIAGSELDLVACSSCATVLHDACWSDLGRCPVLGCGGKAPERARANA
jgi:hypothetical protein